MEIKTAEFVTSMADYGKFPGKGLPQIAVAGKSNVGKSTLINRLCRRNKLARTSSTPGKTRLLNVFLLNGEFHLVDLPGYGFAKVDKKEKERWGHLMECFFTGNDTFDYGVLIVDARHRPTKQDLEMASFFKNSGKPFAVVANKLDKCKKTDISHNLSDISETLCLSEDTPLIPFSAENGAGREELLKLLSV